MLALEMRMLHSFWSLPGPCCQVPRMSPWSWQVSFNLQRWLLLPVQLVLPNVLNHWLRQVRPFRLCVDDPAMMVGSPVGWNAGSAIADRLVPAVIPIGSLVVADAGVAVTAAAVMVSAAAVIHLLNMWPRLLVWSTGLATTVRRCLPSSSM
jgi:hypothetical protein